MGIISTILTFIGFGWGVAFGLIAGYLMFIYFEPDDVKEPQTRTILELDAKSVQNLLLEIPLWVKNPDHEKVDWLNTLMEEMWPYLDKAICKIIREQAEPYIVEYKKKYKLESVEFESLTLGTMPPTVVGVKVQETQEMEMIFEVSLKFFGNSNVKVAVKAYGLKAAAQLVDLQVFLTARITLKPLVDMFPCFSNISVSLMEKPYVDFGLKVLNADLMAIPGVYQYVQNYITTLISGMYLWPRSLDVNVLDESQCKVENQAQGILNVTVLRAKQLKKKDFLGKSDPFVKLTLGDSIQRTKQIRNSLNPEWNETINLVVDDPQTDSLEIAVCDWDPVRSHTTMGVQVIPLRQLVPEQLQVFTLNLLKNLDASDIRNQKHRGQITVEVNYKPFMDEDQSHHDSDDDDAESNDSVGISAAPVASSPEAPPGGGLLVVTVHHAEDLEGKYHTNPYAKITFKGDQRRTKAIKKNRDPRWDTEFEFTLEEPPLNDCLLVEISSKSKNLIHPREALGRVEIDLSDVVKNKRMNEMYQLLDAKNGRVQVELNWKSTGHVNRQPAHHQE